jgi:hypothetical protein
MAGAIERNNFVDVWGRGVAKGAKRSLATLATLATDPSLCIDVKEYKRIPIQAKFRERAKWK